MDALARDASCFIFFLSIILIIIIIISITPYESVNYNLKELDLIKRNLELEEMDYDYNIVHPICIISNAVCSILPIIVLLFGSIATAVLFR